MTCWPQAGTTSTGTLERGNHGVAPASTGPELRDASLLLTEAVKSDSDCEDIFGQLRVTSVMTRCSSCFGAMLHRSTTLATPE
jgi:hypothetical protein